MMRSLFSGVSGLRVHQTKMDVIGNNISNVNTTGYKSSRATFAEIFSQTLSGASAPNNTTGRAGVNPKQIGLGATVASISKNMTEGATQRTDIGSDVKINGDGFFVVGDGAGTYFTRDGSFTLDRDGTLATQSGLKVYGWNVNERGEVIKGQVQPLEIMSGTNMYIEPTKTDNIKFSGNLFTGDCTKTSTGDITPIEKNVFFYDSLGNKYRLPLNFKFTGDGKGTNTWEVTFAKSTPKDKTEGLYMYMNGNTPIALGTDATVGGDTGDGNTPVEIKFGSDGKLDPDSKQSFKFSITAGANSAVDSTFGDAEGNITIDLSTLTQYKEATTAQAQENGNTSGKLSDYSIAEDGIITGIYTNGDKKTFGQIPVAIFSNPAGLQKKGDNLFTETTNSGTFDGTGQDPTAGGGSLSSGTLEMSNVDLSSEFTEMITTQRGFQANSKIITTSDEMLQELVNLKR